MDYEKTTGKCICQLCNNPRKSRSRRNSFRSRKSFDSRKSAEEIQEDKIKNRKRQNSRSVKRRKEPHYEDPYKKRGSRSPNLMKQNIFGGQYSSKGKEIRRRGSGFMPKLNSESNLELKSRFKRSKFGNL